MSKIKNLFWILALSACGNELVPQMVRVPEPKTQSIRQLNLQTSYPLGRPQRLEFDITTQDSTNFEVRAYMKCCKSPVELRFNIQNDVLVVDVEEFWSAGVYVFEIKNLDDNDNELNLFRFEIQAN